MSDSLIFSLIFVGLFAVYVMAQNQSQHSNSKPCFNKQGNNVWVFFNYTNQENTYYCLEYLPATAKLLTQHYWFLTSDCLSSSMQVAKLPMTCWPCKCYLFDLFLNIHPSFKCNHRNWGMRHRRPTRLIQSRQQFGFETRLVFKYTRQVKSSMFRLFSYGISTHIGSGLIRICHFEPKKQSWTRFIVQTGFSKSPKWL